MAKQQKTGRTDRKKAHPFFSAEEVNDENIHIFLKVFSEQHKQFAEEYFKTWNARHSYQIFHKKANNSTAKRQGYKMLHNDNVQLYLQYLARKSSERNQITKDYLIKKQVEVLDQSMSAIPVLDALGRPTGQYVFNAQAANQAIKTLGTEVDFGSTKLKIDHTINNQMQVAVYVVEELRPIDMADTKFQGDLEQVIKKHMKERLKK